MIWSKVQTCIWPSWCHCHSLSLASVKSRFVLPFWYRLTWVVPEKGPLNVCVCVFPCGPKCWLLHTHNAQQHILTWAKADRWHKAKLGHVLHKCQLAGLGRTVSLLSRFFLGWASTRSLGATIHYCNLKQWQHLVENTDGNAYRL